MRADLQFLRRLVGNPDAYAVQDEDGNWKPVREPLTPAVLREHMTGKRTIGTYVLHGDRARTLVFDVDVPDDDELAKSIAADIVIALNTLGVGPASTGIEFSGRKGYHVWVVMAQPVPAADLMRIGRAIRDTVRQPKMEVFPKQAEARDLGNLIKLPGGVHRVTGIRNEFLGPLPRPLPVKALQQLLTKVPEAPVRARTGGGGADPIPCMAAIQRGVEEGGRNNALFHLATMLRRRGLNDEYLEMVIRDVAAKCKPPVEPYEVDALLESSRHAGPICSQMPEGVHCGGLCFMERHDGLYTRPGQVRYASEGEAVVVRIKSNDREGTVRFEHDDLLQGSGRLADKERGSSATEA